MTIDEGHFLLYSHITPALKAGDYRFEAGQSMGRRRAPSASMRATSRSSAADPRPVTAPRYQLPPDQVLSTYPPAGTQGAYGSRLPQIVIKRRTLPVGTRPRIPDGHGGQTEWTRRPHGWRWS